MRRLSHGFGLIEVMVAMLIVSIGVAGVMAYQKTLLREAGTDIQHTTAVSLAQGMLARLRHQGADLAGYLQMQSGQEQLTLSGATYQRRWTVTPQYFAGGGSNATGQRYPHQQQLFVEISWAEGEQSLELSSSLAAPSVASPQNLLAAPAMAALPSVLQPPDSAPDTLAIVLNESSGEGLRRQTSQVKTTDLATPGDRLSQFSTVTFDEQNKTLRRDDFATLSCRCQLNEAGYGATPTRIRPDSSSAGLRVEVGEVVSKHSGVSSDGASPYCDRCCRDHHDRTGHADFPYDPLRGIGHGHYLFAGADFNPFASAALTAGDFQPVLTGAYLEACRMLRVKGYYRVLPDWQLLDVVMLPAAWLAEPEHQARYQQFVLARIKDAITGSQNADKTTLVRSLASTGRSRMLLRGIYLEHLSDADCADLAARLSSPQWPARVPFYELELSQLAYWQSTGQGVTVEHHDNKVYVQIGNAASAVVTARIGRSNSALTQSLPIDLADAQQWHQDQLFVDISP